MQRALAHRSSRNKMPTHDRLFLQKMHGSARGEHLTEDNVYRKDKTVCREENLQIDALAHQYKNTCKRIDHLWKIWREEYLEELRERAQRKHRGPRSKIRREREIDELLLLKGDRPRNSWRMGRVVTLIRGKDSICR
uniref:DUF5641 domain-containing protein n=1 Tax=Wuchereria bancrofti TaxID=6293 RepID=A0AAF5PV68_WUCBA